MSQVNGKPIRERGGSSFRPSRKQFTPPETTGRSVTALVVEAGAFNENRADVEEDPILYGQKGVLNGSPCLRASLTTREHLRILPQEIELERLKDTRRMQLDHKTGTMIETSDPAYRVTWRSDRTLLRRGNPFTMPADFKRQTSRTKRIIHEDREVPAVVEVETDNELDDFTVKD